MALIEKHVDNPSGIVELVDSVWEQFEGEDLPEGNNQRIVIKHETQFELGYRGQHPYLEIGWEKVRGRRKPSRISAEWSRKVEQGGFNAQTVKDLLTEVQTASFIGVRVGNPAKHMKRRFIPALAGLLYKIENSAEHLSGDEEELFGKVLDKVMGYEKGPFGLILGSSKPKLRELYTALATGKPEGEDLQAVQRLSEGQLRAVGRGRSESIGVTVFRRSLDYRMSVFGSLDQATNLQERLLRVHENAWRYYLPGKARYSGRWKALVAIRSEDRRQP